MKNSLQKNAAWFTKTAFHTLLQIWSFLFIAAVSTASYADGFLSTLPDIPLPPSFQEAQNSQVEFDAPTGRILQSLAHGTHDMAYVRQFYDETLPQLGWRRENTGSYIRESERLNITQTKNTTSNKNVTTILLEISPTSP